MFSVWEPSSTKWCRSRKPFEGETPSDTLAAILKTDPPPLAELAPDAPPELVRIVNKTLRKDREQRYQVVKELLIDLRALKQELDFQAKLGGDVSAASGRVARASVANVAPQTSEVRNAISTITNSLTLEIKRHKIAAVLAAILIVAVLVGALWWFYKLRRGAPTHFQATKVTRLTNSGKVIAAVLSPDARYVVYVLSDARKHSIWIRQVSAANDKVIVPPADVGVFGMTVSPDGNELYYAIKQNLDKGTLYRVPIFGGTPVKVLEGIDAPVSFSPDGKRMVVIRGNYPSEGESALVIANVDGSGERILAQRKRPEAFSPIFFTAAIVVSRW